jgi:hypothetical protein
MFDGKGLVDEAYEDGSGPERGIYQAYKLALYLYTLQNAGPYCYGQKRQSLPVTRSRRRLPKTLGMHGERFLMELLVPI